jgi:MoaA/NifB/PqqE/SkfB family radical SAM enzyme
MNTFCVLPWYSVELPSGSPCCLLPANTNIDQLKSDLLSGTASSACNKCWSLEAVNQTSRRQFENSFLDYKLNQDLASIQNDCKIKKIEPVMYQITTSNLCNQACVSCSSQTSSKWAEIDRKLGRKTLPLHSIELSNSDVNYSTAKRISLLGGEPLFDPKTFEILKQLIHHKNTDCFISLITNGSIKLNQTQLNILSKFTDLNICISVDGVGPVFEYLRWPARWNTLVDNLKQYNTITKNISISYTISSLNAMYYDQTIEWFNQNNLRYNHNIVSFPNWLSLKNMPLEFKQNLSKNKNFISNYCDIQGKEISIKLIKSNILDQDRAKKININDYMPEVANLLGVH